MAGFLDRNTRVLDMVLTNRGKDLLAKGQLRFCYWIPYDDDIDYQPYISTSGSMGPEQLSSSIYAAIESTPLREATTGYRFANSSGSDNTNVHRAMFTMAQGQTIVPRAVFPPIIDREVVTSVRNVTKITQDRDQLGKFLNASRPVDLGNERFDSTAFSLEFPYGQDSFSHDFQPEGFLIQIFKSGSDGLVELHPKNDLQNDLCYGSDVRVFTGRRG